MATTPSRAEEKARKVHSLLASYYNVEDGSENPSSTKLGESGQTSPRTPDPKASLQRLLRSARLTDLVAQSSGLAAEVGSLDSDMQMLVYENYNKFIIATDTMRAMAGSLDGMDTKLTGLQSLLGDVMERSADVSGRLDKRQQQIEELSDTRLLLRRLQAVYELPKKIRAALDSGKLEVAVDAHADVLPLLRAHGHKGALRRVAAEIEGLARETLALVKSRMAADPGTASDCIQAMARMGQPPEELEAAFVACKRGVLERTLDIAAALLSSQAAAAGLQGPSPGTGEEGGPGPDPRRATQAAAPGLEADPPTSGARSPAGEGGAAVEAWDPAGGAPSLQQFLVQLDSRFLTELAATCAEFGILFRGRDTAPLFKVLRATFSRYLALTRRALSDATALVAARGAGISVAGRPLVPTAELLAARPGPAQAAAAAVAGAQWSVMEMVGGLYVVKNDIARLESVARELGPKDRASELIEHAVRQHLGLCFAALERRAQAVLGDVGAALADAGGHAERCAILGPASELLRFLIPSDLARLLTCVQAYKAHAWVLAGWREVFLDMLAGRLRHCLASLGREMAAMCHLPTADASGGESSRSRSPSPTRALRLVSTVDGGGVPFAVPRAGASLAGALSPPPDSLLLLLAGVCAALAEGGDVVGVRARLMEGYVQAHGARLELAAHSMTEAGGWRTGKEPRGPRELCVLLLDTLAEVSEEVAVVTATQPLPASTPSHRASPSGSSASGAMDTESMGAAVSRMFASSLERGPGAPAGITPPAVCAAVAARGLAAMAEALHAHTLVRPAFQQIQLDVHFLRAPLQGFVAGSYEEPAVLQVGGRQSFVCPQMRHGSAKCR
ncbi:Vacuolar protein sorting-associated protein 51-like protein [Auxenochlorella protothecoides]|uniref:Vacuolar protein sorting-associated protein 51 homolog n=1 Tax=Auxenochlorella protothecoides TaxID=3075 RepID=A0A087SL27_AUXPR|nr:Vacuolar protein sorting-associated protein 51-like protein [Auxenochlorella protothecoides]KFM26431.1 Vacuolar protein sorting-associated protein 51-like protein [Auxenochlorella protothecoides]